MIRLLSLFIVLTVMATAAEAGKSSLSSYAILAGGLAVIVLFFWGIYKAVRTQKLIYALALLPFTILLFWMFFS